MRRPTPVDLVYGEPVDVPLLDAEVTLVRASRDLFVDPETGKRGESFSGLLRIVDRQGEATELPFGRGEAMIYRDHRLSLRGADLSWQLFVRPPE
ncbi:MAG TPA: hypothetical protein ENK18_26415 [Deltaproteobacteria bacterium]|nr:hypothetical protein [Deltaproteobacteria bacterium]